MTSATTASEIIAALAMARHPEGGWYVETYREPAPAGGRGSVTAIHFLLEAGQRSHWHKVDATELWLWQGGGPLELAISADGRSVERLLLGPDLKAGQRLQAVVPPHAWQAATPPDGWALVSCVVAPAFQFEGFELAPDGWQPGTARPDPRSSLGSAQQQESQQASVQAPK